MGRFGVLEDNVNDLFKRLNINKTDISAIPTKPSKGLNLFLDMDLVIHLKHVISYH